MKECGCKDKCRGGCGTKTDECEPKCKPQCAQKDCDIRICEEIRPEVLCCKYNNAVVTIQSEFILTGRLVQTADPPTPINNLTPLGSNLRRDIILSGNGFFTRKHYIITAAQNVLMPPAFTSALNRYPYYNEQTLNDVGVAGNAFMQNEMVRASRILVTVNNVNNKAPSYVYEADLVGVDGAGDIAVLEIKYNKRFNRCNPCILSCHPYFDFAKARSAICGDKVYMIGDPVGNINLATDLSASGAMINGIVSNARHLDYSGWMLSESVLVSAPVFGFNAGMPIFNAEGKVIAMQTTVSVAKSKSYRAADPPTASYLAGQGFVAGPSVMFMQRVIGKLIRGTCSKKRDCQLETICDPVGSYYRYKKAYMGLAYEVFTGADYTVTRDYSGSSEPLVSETQLQPRIRLDENGEFVDGPDCKQIVGLRIIGIAGLNPGDVDVDGPAGTAVGVDNGAVFVPGGVYVAVPPVAPPNNGATGMRPLNADLPVSPLLNRLKPGDVITHLDSYALGDLKLDCGKGQIAPSLITWKLCAGDQVSICYLRGGNVPNDDDEGEANSNADPRDYDSLYSQRVCLADYPALMDYPYYAITKWPQILDIDIVAADPYPVFAPALGVLGTQELSGYPAIEDHAPFHPAV